MQRDDRIGVALDGLMAVAWTAVCVLAGPPRGDFANYWTSAALWLQGTNLARLYEYAWFQEQAAPWFGERLVGFAVLTPPSALLAVPLVPLGPEGGAVAWWVGQWALGLALGLVLARLMAQPLWVGLAALLCCGPALESHLHQGQMHLPVVLLVAGGMLAFARERDPLAGVCWAFAVGLKVHAWPLLVLAALAGRWRVVSAAALTLSVGFAASVALLGWPVHAVFLSRIAPAASGGWFVDPWTPALQSWGHLVRRLLVPHPGLNPDGPWHAPGLASALVALVFAAVCGATLARAASWRELGEGERVRLVAAASVAALVGGSILARYHLLMVLPAVALATSALWERDRGRALGIAALCFAACWVPVPTTWPGGLLDAVAIPRFWLLLGAWALMMPWGAVPWKVGGAVGAAGAAMVGLAVLGTPVLPDGERIDGPHMPLVVSHLHVHGDALVFRGLTREGWQWLRREPDGAVAAIDDPGLGPSSQAVDAQGRTYFLSDAGVGVMADRVWRR